MPLAPGIDAWDRTLVVGHTPAAAADVVAPLRTHPALEVEGSIADLAGHTAAAGAVARTRLSSISFLEQATLHVKIRTLLVLVLLVGHRECLEQGKLK